MSIIGSLCVSLVVGCGLTLALRWFVTRRRRERAGGAFSDPGVTIEMDCRSCKQFNRVPSHRLRNRPKCGRCKARLMPGKRLVLCRVSPMQGPLSAELDKVWPDEDRLWQSLADHVGVEARVRAEGQGVGS